MESIVHVTYMRRKVQLPGFRRISFISCSCALWYCVLSGNWETRSVR